MSEIVKQHVFTLCLLYFINKLYLENASNDCCSGGKLIGITFSGSNNNQFYNKRAKQRNVWQLRNGQIRNKLVGNNI